MSPPLSPLPTTSTTTTTTHYDMQSNKSLPDSFTTPTKRIEALKQQPSSQPSEYGWREQAVMRFGLPEKVTMICSGDDYGDGGDGDGDDNDGDGNNQNV